MGRVGRTQTQALAADGSAGTLSGVTLGRLLSVIMPQCLHLQNGNDEGSTSWGYDEIASARSSASLRRMLTNISHYPSQVSTRCGLKHAQVTR